MKGEYLKIKKASLVLVVILITAFLFSFYPQPNGSLKAQMANENLLILNQELDAKRKEIKNIKEQIEGYKTQINEIQNEKASLSNQINILDSRIAKNRLNIKTADREIEVTKLEIKDTKLRIQEKEYEIEKQKQVLGEFIRLINKYDRQSYVEVLLANDSFSEFFDQIKYLENIENDVVKILNKVKEFKRDLELKEQDLEKKKEDLNKLKEKIEREKAALEDEIVGKEILLDETAYSEEAFQRLLSQLRQEQSAVNADLSSIEKKIRDKLNLEAAVVGEANLIWPVDASMGISAYFHDPGYPYRHIFEHPGIDIRVYQGTILRAAENGYVARARDAGKGYSYIMLVHADGLSTVYGHVSKIMVAQDTYVVKGQTIGLSGGMPGTPGAGRLTTGPHLHFEVRHNGIPVNPLDYLP